jgi:hypothetical protein
LRAGGILGIKAADAVKFVASGFIDVTPARKRAHIDCRLLLGIGVASTLTIRTPLIFVGLGGDEGAD